MSELTTVGPVPDRVEDLTVHGPPSWHGIVRRMVSRAAKLAAATSVLAACGLADPKPTSVEITPPQPPTNVPFDQRVDVTVVPGGRLDLSKLNPADQNLSRVLSDAVFERQVNSIIFQLTLKDGSQKSFQVLNPQSDIPYQSLASIVQQYIDAGQEIGATGKDGNTAKYTFSTGNRAPVYFAVANSGDRIRNAWLSPELFSQFASGRTPGITTIGDRNGVPFLNLTMITTGRMDRASRIASILTEYCQATALPQIGPNTNQLEQYRIAKEGYCNSIGYAARVAGTGASYEQYIAIVNEISFRLADGTNVPSILLPQDQYARIRELVLQK